MQSQHTPSTTLWRLDGVGSPSDTSQLFGERDPIKQTGLEKDGLLSLHQILQVAGQRRSLAPIGYCPSGCPRRHPYPA